MRQAIPSQRCCLAQITSGDWQNHHLNNDSGHSISLACFALQSSTGTNDMLTKNELAELGHTVGQAESNHAKVSTTIFKLVQVSTRISSNIPLLASYVFY